MTVFGGTMDRGSVAARLALAAGLLALCACDALDHHASRDGEARKTAANDRPYFPDLPKVRGAGDLPPPGEDPVARGQYIMTSGGGGGIANACLTCHGIDGAGDAANGAPRIGGMPAAYMWGAMRAYALDLRPHPAMTRVAKALSERDWWAVSAYYESRATRGTGAGPEGEAELVARGALLHAEGDPGAGLRPCASCHGPGALGPTPAIPPLAGQHAAYTAGQLVRWQTGRRTDDPLGAMRQVAEAMSQRDIAAAAAYYASLPADWSGTGRGAAQAPAQGESDQR